MSKWYIEYKSNGKYCYMGGIAANSGNDAIKVLRSRVMFVDRIIGVWHDDEEEEQLVAASINSRLGRKRSHLLVGGSGRTYTISERVSYFQYKGVKICFIRTSRLNEPNGRCLLMHWLMPWE